MTISVDKESVASALYHNLGTRSPKRLIPYLSVCSASDRACIAQKLAQVQPWDEEIRQTLFSLIGDASSWVRSQVLQSLANCTITPTEAIELEGLLTRKSGDLRRGLLQLLLNQSDINAKSSAERLLNAALLQRQAGLELLSQMVAKNRLVTESRTLAQEYQSQRQKQTATEKQLLNTILADSQEVLTLDNALSLLGPSQRTAPKLTDVATSFICYTCRTSLFRVLRRVNSYLPPNSVCHDNVIHLSRLVDPGYEYPSLFASFLDVSSTYVVLSLN